MNKQLVLYVGEITVEPVESSENVRLVVKGISSTPGWTELELLLQNPTKQDSFLNFDLVALPPQGIVPQVQQTLSKPAVTIVSREELKGITIFAAANSKKVQFPR